MSAAATAGSDHAYLKDVACMINLQDEGCCQDAREWQKPYQERFTIVIRTVHHPEPAKTRYAGHYAGWRVSTLL